MTAIISDWLDGLRDAFKPSAATAKWNMGVTIGKYYKRMIIPLILAMIIEAILIPWAIGTLAPSAANIGMAGSVLTSVEILALIIAYLLIVPMALLIQAFVYHIFGQMVGAVTKGNYSDTLSVVLHASMPNISLYFVWVGLVWLLIGLAGAAGLLAGLIIIIIVVAIWQLIVFVTSFSKIHKTTKMKAFLAWLLPLIIEVIAIIAIALFAGVLSGIPPSAAPGAVV